MDNELNPESGGSSRSLDLIAKMLEERGHNVNITIFNREVKNITQGSTYDIEEKRYSNRLDGAWSIVEFMQEHERDFDLFHLYNPAYLPLGGAYKLVGGTTPVVGRLNNYSLFCTNRQKMAEECYYNCSLMDKIKHDSVSIRKKLATAPQYLFINNIQHQLANNVDRIFALSPAVRKIYVKNGISEDIIHIVPNFYDTSFRDGFHENRECLNPPYKLLYVGRITNQKGLDLLLRAVSQIDIDAEVTIVGDGPVLSDLYRLSEKLLIEDRVSFPGWVNYKDLPNYYFDSDIFVHPGRWPEPFNRTLLEAMQCELPLIVSDVGGPPWVVGNAGQSFKSEDPASLAAEISNLLSNHDILKQKRIECQKRLREFSPENVIDTIEQEYLSLVAI